MVRAGRGVGTDSARSAGGPFRAGRARCRGRVVDDAPAGCKQQTTSQRVRGAHLVWQAAVESWEPGPAVRCTQTLPHCTHVLVLHGALGALGRFCRSFKRIVRCNRWSLRNGVARDEQSHHTRDCTTHHTDPGYRHTPPPTLRGASASTLGPV